MFNWERLFNWSSPTVRLGDGDDNSDKLELVVASQLPNLEFTDCSAKYGRTDRPAYYHAETDESGPGNMICVNPKKLEEILVLLTKQDPDDLILRMKLCELSVAREDWPEVIERSYEALYVNVMQPKPHKWLALAYRKEKKFTKAIEEYEILAELDSNDIESRLHWAETCLEADDKKQAKVVLADLLKERPQYKAAKELLEKINRELFL